MTACLTHSRDGSPTDWVRNPSSSPSPTQCPPLSPLVSLPQKGSGGFWFATTTAAVAAALTLSSSGLVRL